jgi:hypothetical protein
LKPGKNPDGWIVAALSVERVRSLGLQVIHDPQPHDQGHCEIRASPSARFSGTKSTKLAEMCRLLDESEVDSIGAGDEVQV